MMMRLQKILSARVRHPQGMAHNWTSNQHLAWHVLGNDRYQDHDPSLLINWGSDAATVKPISVISVLHCLVWMH